ncbi:MAG TPA: SgcJ/EcaC family oxidoreductase [Vicinamibacteria bacterium]|nr:SgcJ/EcaC family oxidoreductase [Vicinamibacteria bacterium]
MSVFGRIAVVVSVLALFRCTPPPPAEPPDTREADEAAIRAAVKEWSAAAEAKDANKFVSFYTDDGTLMLEGAPDASGHQALLEGASGMMQDPNFALSFRTDDVVVARSGDLAYETGSYTLTMSGADGSPAPSNGHYVVVWKKTGDGSWKAAVDAPISDPPAAQ